MTCKQDYARFQFEKKIMKKNNCGKIFAKEISTRSGIPSMSTTSQALAFLLQEFLT